MKKIILYILLLFLLSGCEQSETKTINMFDPYHKRATSSTTIDNKIKKSREIREAEKERAIALAKLKSEENLKLAEIEAKTKEKVKQIEIEATKLKVMSEKEVSLENQKIQKAIAFLKEKTTLDTKDKDIYLNQIAIISAIVMLILILLVYYITQHKKRGLELKIQEEKLKHEAYMQASAQQHEKITRVLEIIADKDTDEYIKGELITIIKEQPQDQSLITYNPEESNSQSNENVTDSVIDDDTKDSDTIDIEEDNLSPSEEVVDSKEPKKDASDKKMDSDENR